MEEYIVVDGGSNDGTVGIINSFRSGIAKLISGPDGGIYDAINKGIQCSSGDIIGILNADDYYTSTKVVQHVVEKFQSTGSDIVYGNLRYVVGTVGPRVVRNWRSGQFRREKLRFGWMPPHPATFVKADAYRRFGTYSLQYSISADYDFLLRVLVNPETTVGYVDEYLVSMHTGGISNRNAGAIIAKMRQDRRIIKKHHVGGAFTLVMKTATKLTQYMVPFVEAIGRSGNSQDRP